MSKIHFRVGVFVLFTLLAGAGFLGLGWRGVGVGFQSSPYPPPSCDASYIAWYKFATDVDPQPDSSCNDNDMDVNGGEASEPTWTDLTNGGYNALSFDGTADFATTPHDATLSTKGFVIHYWSKTEASSGYVNLCYKGTTAAENASFVIHHNRKYTPTIYLHADEGGRLFADPTYGSDAALSNVWNHCVFIWDGGTATSNLTVYINKVPLTTSTDGTFTTYKSNTMAMTWGKPDGSYATTTYWPGLVSDWRMVPYSAGTHTATWVTNQYNDTKAHYGL